MGVVRVWLPVNAIFVGMIGTSFWALRHLNVGMVTGAPGGGGEEEALVAAAASCRPAAPPVGPAVAARPCTQPPLLPPPLQCSRT